MNCPKCKSSAIYLTSDPFRGKDIVCVKCGTIIPWAWQFKKQQEMQAEKDKRTLERLSFDILRRTA